jgi:putative restriction endonuclease
LRYWWVNQNQTYRHEVAGNYLWSPKRNANGNRNPFYDFMREVAPGDVVFSFADTLIKAIGFAASNAYEAPKPLEFGKAGAYWDTIGWRVDVQFTEVRLPIRPADHMAVLGPLLPNMYSPLQPDGRGLQSVYLTSLSDALAAGLVDLMGAETRTLINGYQAAEQKVVQAGIGLVEWEEHEIADVRNNAVIPETTREQIVLARRGQGEFKRRVMEIEHACRITKVRRIEHLRASHCKPWRDSDNEERLDGENGLLLTPNADHLFDRGFIGFDDNGDVLISPVAHKESLARLGLEIDRLVNVGAFSQGQRRYLDFHREYVFLRSAFLDSTKRR